MALNDVTRVVLHHLERWLVLASRQMILPHRYLTLIRHRLPPYARDARRGGRYASGVSRACRFFHGSGAFPRAADSPVGRVWYSFLRFRPSAPLEN